MMAVGCLPHTIVADAPKGSMAPSSLLQPSCSGRRKTRSSDRRPRANSECVLWEVSTGCIRAELLHGKPLRPLVHAAEVLSLRKTIRHDQAGWRAILSQPLPPKALPPKRKETGCCTDGSAPRSVAPPRGAIQPAPPVRRMKEAAQVNGPFNSRPLCFVERAKSGTIPADAPATFALSGTIAATV
jgi:hypothetical protein